MIRKQCRYIDINGRCTVEDKVCNSCKRSSTVRYEVVYKPIEGITTVTIKDKKGAALISSDIYGQLSEVLSREYAKDLVKILWDTGVIK